MNTRVRSLLVVAMLSLGMSVCDAGEAGSKDDLEAHFKLDEEATANFGLPVYPGSKPYNDDDDSSSSANVRLSTPWFGLKVAAMNRETPDEPEQVASFYRQALSRYGNVLECRDEKKGKKPRSSNGLECDTGETKEHSLVYKVGTEENQRIVAIKPYGNGTRFSLVHVDVRGRSK